MRPIENYINPGGLNGFYSFRGLIARVAGRQLRHLDPSDDCDDTEFEGDETDL